MPPSVRPSREDREPCCACGLLYLGNAMPNLDFEINVASSLAGISPAAWDACANPTSSNEDNPLSPAADSLCDADNPESRQPDSKSEVPAKAESNTEEERTNPFISYDFLRALEASGSVGGRTGWSPAYVLTKDAGGQLVGAAPAYLKSHSQGEYVFDHGWADAYERAGGRYYPKLQVATPFTPATGRRLLTAAPSPDAPPDWTAQLRGALLGGLRAVRTQAKASSTHLTFCTKPEWDWLGHAGLLQRTGQQFHFFNRGYADFDAFLASLASRKRKMIRRERQQAVENGITIEPLTGSDITEAHWDDFYRFYMDTGSRKWGRPYLTRRFFSEAGARMADRILLVMAKRGGKYIAGAINFIGTDALYGRNWGAVEHHPFLHFEVCYYQAIDFALKCGLSRVEAGAQGEHKLARGYEPVTTYSAHDIADPRLSRAIADYLAQERVHVAEEIELYAEHTPFRRDTV